MKAFIQSIILLSLVFSILSVNLKSKSQTEWIHRPVLNTGLYGGGLYGANVIPRYGGIYGGGLLRRRYGGVYPSYGAGLYPTYNAGLYGAAVYPTYNTGLYGAAVYPSYNTGINYGAAVMPTYNAGINYATPSYASAGKPSFTSGQANKTPIGPMSLNNDQSNQNNQSGGNFQLNQPTDQSNTNNNKNTQPGGSNQNQ